MACAHHSGKCHGREYPRNLIILNNIGSIYYELSRYSDAQIYYQRALTIQEKCYGLEHIQTALILISLGNTYCELGKYTEAQRCYQRALIIRKRYYGSDSPQVAAIFNNLGQVYCELGKYAEAQRHYCTALTIQEKRYGSNHTETALELYNLAHVLVEQKFFDEARQLFERAIKIYTPLQHPNLENATLSLLSSYIREGNAYFLEQNPDIEHAKACYQKVEADLISKMQQTLLAKSSYEANKLNQTIEHNFILLRLNSKNASACLNLACCLHVRAQLEKTRGDNNEYLSSLKVAQEYFVKSINLNPDPGVYTEYANFMWRNYAYYSINDIIKYLQYAIEFNQEDKEPYELNYGKMERLTVSQGLRDLIDQEKTISFPSALLAHYLLLEIYSFQNNRQKINDILNNFQKTILNFQSRLELDKKTLANTKFNQKTIQIIQSIKKKQRLNQTLSIMSQRVAKNYISSLKNLCFQTLWRQKLRKLPHNYYNQKIPSQLQKEYKSYQQ